MFNFRHSSVLANLHFPFCVDFIQMNLHKLNKLSRCGMEYSYSHSVLICIDEKTVVRIFFLLFSSFFYFRHFSFDRKSSDRHSLFSSLLHYTLFVIDCVCVFYSFAARTCFTLLIWWTATVTKWKQRKL